MNEQHIEDLIRKYADGTATDEEVTRLLAWYRSASIEEVEWPGSDSLEKENLRLRLFERIRKDLRPATRKRRIFQLPLFRAAAVFIPLAGIALLAYYFLNPRQTSYITRNNPAGKIELVKLPDGSQVWLNASGTIHYAANFTENRKIKLEGEAYFEVSHDPSHPFEVETGRLTTKVLGTEFNVRSYQEDSVASVTLLKGSVSVTRDQTSLAVLEPLFQLNYNKQTDKINIKPADTSSTVAWKKGRLQFAGASLGDIAATLERWYGVTVRFSNENMRRCRYFMAFDSVTSLENLFSAMAAITDMTYNIDKTNKTVTISGQGCD